MEKTVMRAASAMTGGIVAAGLMLAPATIATAEPIAPGGAYATIGQLEASGYDVNIDRVGSAPLDQCVVTSVRNPQDIPAPSEWTTAATATRGTSTTSKSWCAGRSPSRSTA